MKDLISKIVYFKACAQFNLKSQSLHQNDKGKTLDKAMQKKKTDHKSKFGSIST